MVSVQNLSTAIQRLYDEFIRSAKELGTPSDLRTIAKDLDSTIKATGFTEMVAELERVLHDKALTVADLKEDDIKKLKEYVKLLKCSRMTREKIPLTKENLLRTYLARLIKWIQKNAETREKLKANQEKAEAAKAAKQAEKAAKQAEKAAKQAEKAEKQAEADQTKNQIKPEEIEVPVNRNKLETDEVSEEKKQEKADSNKSLDEICDEVGNNFKKMLEKKKKPKTEEVVKPETKV